MSSDRQQQLRVLSLFAGIGGIDLGLERAGMEIVAHSEIDPYACRVLAKHWPGIPNLGDITGIEAIGEGVGLRGQTVQHWTCDHGERRVVTDPVDVIAGGFPCQDISLVGKGAGIAEGTRSGLWSEYVRLIRDLRPRYVIVENVAALTTRGLDRVLGDLATLGFDAEWSVLSACAVGAPHPRERLFIVAYPHTEHGPQGLGHFPQLRGAASEPGADASSPWADAVVRYVQANTGGAGVADGIPDRLERAGACGNAVVPQVAEYVGRLVVEHHERQAVAA